MSRPVAYSLKSPRRKVLSQHLFANRRCHVFLSGTPEDLEGHTARVPLHPGTKEFSLAIKDNIATCLGHTSCASRILSGHSSPFEAHVVLSLKQMSAQNVGKTNMDEFGMGSHSSHSSFGPLHILDKSGKHRMSPGGSSGGSAIAVANKLCTVALGTDTGGSVRLPAAYCAVLGFKPSYGYISRWGVVPYANSLDTVGIMASSMEILEPAFLGAAKADSKDPTSLTERSRLRCTRRRDEDRRKGQKIIKHCEGKTPLPLNGIKIGFPLEYNIAELDSEVRGAWEYVLETCREQGATIQPVSLPNTKHALSAYYVIAPAEAASNLSKYDGVRYGTRNGARDGAGHVLYSDTRGAGFGEEVQKRILLGSYTLSSEAIDNYFIKAQKVRRLVQRDFDRVFCLSNPLRDPEQFDLSEMDDAIPLEDKLGPGQVDFIICPTAPTLPPTIEEVAEQTSVDAYMNDVFTVPASLAGLPALNIPWPVRSSDVDGSPDLAGIQIIGQYSDDNKVLELGKALEKIRNERHKDFQPIQALSEAA